MRHRYQGGCRTGSSLLGFNFLLSTLPLFEAAAWTSFDSHLYTHITTKLSWQAARASCQSLAVGGDLVALESAEEEAFVVGTVMNGVVVDTWIGCAYVADAWTWVTTGKSCSDVNSDIYTWWTPNEPTTSEGEAAAVPPCGSFWDSRGDIEGISVWNEKGNVIIFYLTPEGGKIFNFIIL